MPELRPHGSLVSTWTRKRRGPTAAHVLAALVVLLAILAATPLVLLAAVDHGLFDGAIQRIASARLQRRISFSELHTRLLSPHPTVVLRDLVVGSPAAISKADLLHAPLVTAQVALSPLLAGRIQPVELTLDRPQFHLVRQSIGHTNYIFGHGGASTLIAGIKRLVIVDGRVEFDDIQPHRIVLGSISHDDRNGPSSLRLDGEGKVWGVPFTVKAQGAAVNGRAPGTPYPLRIEFTDKDQRLALEGTTIKPFDFSRFDLYARASGPNLADLGYLFTLRTPNSSPYQLTAQVHREGPKIHLSQVRGQVGRSDIVAGEVFSDRSVHPAHIRLWARSGTLYLDDLRAFTAAIPPHDQTRSQAGTAAIPAKPRGAVFSDTPFQLQRIRAENLDADLRADHLAGLPIPLADVHAKLAVGKGRLVASPMSFTLPSGRGDASLTLDARGSTPDLQVSASVQGVRVGALGKGLTRTLDGAFDGWLSAHGRGGSFHAAAADAQGRAAFTLTDGVFIRSKAAALSGDLVQAIGLSLGDKNARTPLRCAVAQLDISRGVLRPDRLAVVTGVGFSSGAGRIDLGAQTLALEFHGVPAQRHILQLNAPVKLSGPLAHPTVKVRMGQAIKQAGPKGVLALAASPFAGLLPKVGPPTPQPDCGPLVAQAAQYAR